MTQDTKKQLLNLLKTVGCWLAFLALLFGIFYLMFMFSEDAGYHSSSGGFLASEVYDLNLPVFLAGIPLSLALFAAVWIFVQRKTWRTAVSGGVLWAVLWCLWILPVLFLVLFAYFAAMILAVDLFVDFEPAWPVYYFVPYLILMAAVILTGCIRVGISVRRAAKAAAMPQ